MAIELLIIHLSKLDRNNANANTDTKNNTIL